MISLAAIFTLPIGFPDRELLHFCALVVVLVTLIGQGLTFAPLVRRLGLRANEADKARIRNEARSASVQAAHRPAGRDPACSSTTTSRTTRSRPCTSNLETRLERYRRRLDMLEKSDSDQVPDSPQYEAALMVRRAVIDAQREELLRWRDAGRLSDQGLRVLERELDHEELPAPEAARR